MYMYHKISQMCDKVDVIKTKADELRKVKYQDKSHGKTWQKSMCDLMVEDIQQLCREISFDTGATANE